MRRLVLTGWSGTAFARMAAITVPLQERYAKRHGMDFCCGNLFGERPPSWNKVMLILSGLQKYDEILWLDADVVVIDNRENVFDSVSGDWWHAVVQHDTPSGLVPNCGVWLVRPQMVPTLRSVWDEGRNITHLWWEQASILERMGYTVTDKPHATPGDSTELLEHTGWLDSRWNHHPLDAEKTETPAFVHVTGYKDRLDAASKAAEIAL